VSLPVSAAGEVLVKTIAVSINPIDWKLRRGELKEMMPIEFPAILGRDLSGEVFALGEGVTGLKVGDRVFGLVNHSYAEYVVCKSEDLARTPDALDSIDAVRWRRLFGQVIRVFKWKNCSASCRRGCGNVKIGFIDFQGLVGRAENSSIVFRAFHETGISTACFIAR
jgi:hypothetical protein